MRNFRDRTEVERVLREHGNAIFRAAVTILGSMYDAEEIVQETMITYMTTDKEFCDKNYEKAWLLRVAINKSKNLYKQQKRYECMDDSQLQNMIASEENLNLMQDLLQLPAKIRIAIYLHYYEGYSCEEIGTILKVSKVAVKKRLQRGREQLKELMR